MAGSTAKKVIVRRFDRENLPGFVNVFSYLQPQHIELLNPRGALVTLPYTEVKSVCFVRDLDAEADTGRIFLTRPKRDGVWIRMSFRDAEVMDGLLPNNLLLWDTVGYTVTPPEMDGNNQKVFVPREALTSVQIMGIVGSPLRAPRKKASPMRDQPTLF